MRRCEGEKNSQRMDLLISRHALSTVFRFTIVWALLLGLLCIQSDASRSTTCDRRTHFACQSNLSLCLPIAKLGDGREDCPDGSDEDCPNGMYRCSSGLPRCIRQHQVGDGVRQCQDGSDEDFREVLAENMSNNRLLQADSHNQHQDVKATAAVLGITTKKQQFGSLQSGKVFLTAVNEPISALSSSNAKPIEVTGTFIPPNDPLKTKQFGLDIDAKTVGTAFPDKTASSIIRVTGTAGTFVNQHSKTYPVYTGSYVKGDEDPTTYRFFYGDHPLTSNVKVVLPSAMESAPELSDKYLAEESEHQASFTSRSKNLSGEKHEDEIYRNKNNSMQHLSAVPTKPAAQPLVMTRYIEPVNYPGRGSSGLKDNNKVESNSEEESAQYVATTLRGHDQYYRHNRMYNPSPRKIDLNSATVVADQIIDNRQIGTSPLTDGLEPDKKHMNNAYFELNRGNLQDRFQHIVRPTSSHRQSFKDKRLTRTVGLYGPIYDTEELRPEFKPAGEQNEDSFELPKPKSNENDDADFTTTLYGFADFTTRISGTHYIFLPASTRPRTFTPRVTRTSFSNDINIALRSTEPTSQLVRKPLLDTESSELQFSTLTPSLKEYMTTSTVAPKAATEIGAKLRKIEETIVAQTLPLNLATVYGNNEDKEKPAYAKDFDLKFQPFRPQGDKSVKSAELDVSQIVDTIKESEVLLKPSNPTGLVSSITGTEVSDGVTTHWTTLIFGTYIDNTYAHVIESTSSIFFTVAKTISPEETFLNEKTVSDDISNNNLQNLEIKPSSKYDFELVSSFADIKNMKGAFTDNPIGATPSLEILTSGFILPRSGRNNDAPVFSNDPLTTIKFDSTEISEDLNEKRTNEVPSPGVEYANDPTQMSTEKHETEAVHILTDGFILPGSLTISPISTVDEVMKNPETSKSMIASKHSKEMLASSARFLDDLDALINERPLLENEDKEKASADEERETTDASNSVVLLTGDFILPTSPTEENIAKEEKLSSDVILSETPSIITDDFILPSAVLMNSNENEKSSDGGRILNKDSLSILTDGFILPGVEENVKSTNVKIEMTNTLPSSALLTADFNAENELDESLSKGRSAGDADKLILLDSTILSAKDNISPIDGEYMASNVEEVLNNNKDSGHEEHTNAENKDSDSGRIVPSMSFPITYYTTSTFFTTYLLDGKTAVSSREQTFTHVYTDSKELENAKINPTKTVFIPKTIKPDIVAYEDEDLTTFTYFTTFYKDGNKIVSSRVETEKKSLIEPKTPSVDSSYPVMTYPTTYYTTLTYFTTLLHQGTSEVVTNTQVISSVVTPPLQSGDVPITSSPVKELPLENTNDLKIAPTTYFTTYTYYTTFHKDGTTSVKTNYRTVTNVLDGNDSSSETKQPPLYTTDLLEKPSETNGKLTTVFTTYTYYTTYIRDGSPSVSSREEIISKVIGTTPVHMELETKPAENPMKFTTFYTTYTYYTTLLKDGMTTVSTRRETVSNVMPKETSVVLIPTIARTESPEMFIKPSATVKTYFTTYTYFTTLLRDGSPVVSSREATVSNVVTEHLKPAETSNTINPTRSLATFFTTLTSYLTLFNAGISSVSTIFSTLTEVVAMSTPLPELALKSEVAANSLHNNHFVANTQPAMLFNSPNAPFANEKRENQVSPALNISPITIAHAVTPFSALDASSLQPTAVITKTYYSTYTFFTTYLYKGSPSVTSRLETVTNYVTESLSHTPGKTAIALTPEKNDFSENTLKLENAHKKNAASDDAMPVSTAIIHATPVSTAINTVYTTFTYYTTLLQKGSPVIKTRLETSTNFITVRIIPTLVEKPTKLTTDLEAAEGGLHEKRIQPTPPVTYYSTHHYVSPSVGADGKPSLITREVIATATVKHEEVPEVMLKPSIHTEECCSTSKYPYTFYTTYTHYTTRYHGDRPIINTRYETITNVIKAPIAATTDKSELINVLPSVSKLAITPAVNSIAPASPINAIFSSGIKTFEMERSNREEDDVGNDNLRSLNHNDENNLITSPEESFDNNAKTSTVLTSSETAEVTENLSNVEVTSESNNEISITQDNSYSQTENTHNMRNDSNEIGAEEVEFNIENKTESFTTETITKKEKTEENVLETTTVQNTSKDLTTEPTTTESITEETSNEDTSTVTEAPKRNVFSRRRNRPQYKPRPSFRSSSTTTTTTTTTKRPLQGRVTPSAPVTRSPSAFGRRNSTRLLYRRPSLAPRVNPLNRFRTLRTTTPPSDSEEETSTKRRRRSFFAVDENYLLKPHIRKLLSTSVDENVDVLEKNNDLLSDKNADKYSSGKDYPVGLIQSMENQVVNNGVTTVYGTEIHGTFINGAYARVVQSNVRLLTETSSSLASTPFISSQEIPSSASEHVSHEANKVGLVSSKISTVVKDGTSTVFTTNVYGTYIGEVYAHLAQTTSSIIQPTAVNQNVYPTGLLSSIVRTEANQDTTTVWTTNIYGTFVNNYYAHIPSTTSNVHIGPQTTHINKVYEHFSHDNNQPVPTARSIETPPEHKTGLLSSLVSEEENDGTTTQYVTNVYGTYVGNHYAKHAQATSKIILPTKTESPMRSVGLLSTIVNSIINGNSATLLKTEIYGTYIGDLYAQLARVSTEYKPVSTQQLEVKPVPPVTQKTGLLSSSVVRSEINQGTTTMHINEIYGTYIGNAYAHVAKSTSKVVKPSLTESKSAAPNAQQKTGLISSSVKTEVNDGTTTLHIAEVHGTYVGNYYAHVARRTSSVLPYVTPTKEYQAPSSMTLSHQKPEGLISSEIRTEVNQGTTTLHTREIHGTYINGFYAHVARSSSNIISPSSTSPVSSTRRVSAITSSEINDGILTIHTTEIYGTRINGFYAHIARSSSRIVTSTAEPQLLETAMTSSIQSDQTDFNQNVVSSVSSNGQEPQVNSVTKYLVDPVESLMSTLEVNTKPGLNSDYKTSQLVGPAKDDLDTSKVNELDNGNVYVSLTEDGDLGLKTSTEQLAGVDLLTPSVSAEVFSEQNLEKGTPILSSVPDIVSSSFEFKKVKSEGDFNSKSAEAFAKPSSEILPDSSSKKLKKEEKSSELPSDDYNDYNDYADNKSFKDKELITAKPPRDENGPRKNKVPPLSSSRKFEPEEDYDDFSFEDDYEDFDDKKQNKKVTPSVPTTRFKNTRQTKRKSSLYGNRDYDEYDDYDYPDNETPSLANTKSSDFTTTKEAPSSSVRIRPFIGRGRPTYTTPSRSSLKASYTIQFRRPSRTRNSRAFGQRSDSENDFDDDGNEDEEEGDIEASEAVVTTATPQALTFNRRKPFGSSRYQSPGRNAASSTTSKPANNIRNRRPFGRTASSTSPSPTPSLKDTVPDYEENTTEDDDFDEYDDISDKKEANRNRNFRSTRRPPSRQTRFGERRSASNKRGSFRNREDEEIENDDFDATTPNYRNSRNRNQRKPSRGRQNRNNSPSLKSSFNSVSREDDDDSQSLQPLNRIRNNNRNRRPSYNPRTRRPSKTAIETETIRKPYLTVTSVVTTVKTLPIYHGFRTSYATLTTTALDTSIIHPTQYSEVINDGITKTVFYSKTGYPDGFENLHTTITEVVVTTTSLASVKLVPIKIGFSTRTDTVTDIQVLTTLATMYSTIIPDSPQPTAFPQQFQPNFFPQLAPQNPNDFGLLASANSFVTTQIVTATTVVPIILRGRTILSTLTTTSTAESTVVQTVRLPQVPSAAPFIPQPYFAFQPLTTLLTLYVTGEHGELKPVVTTVTVPLYQQPVFHTKVARSLQQNAVLDHTLKTADIMSVPLKSSISYIKSKELDIDTHYDKLLSSGLEEINDLTESSASHHRTEPLDSTQFPKELKGVTTYDVTTISKGPLTEIYEQKVTINLNNDESMKFNEINTEKDTYGLESRYSFRKLQQFIEDEPVFRPQRDFTRLQRPPPNVIIATVPNHNVIFPTAAQNIPPRGNPRQFPPPRRVPSEFFNEEPRETGFRDLSAGRRPLRRPEGNFRPFLERPSLEIRPSRGELPVFNIEPSRNRPIPGEDIEEIQDLLFSLQNSNRNPNRPAGFSPEIDNSNEFRPLVDAGLRRPIPGADDLNNVRGDSGYRPRRLRITRPINAADVTNSGVRRISRIRPAETPSPLSESLNNFAIHTPVVSTQFTELRSESPAFVAASNIDSDDPDTKDDDENVLNRRTVIRRVRPNFVPGDGNGARRPGLIRRTRINEQVEPSKPETQPTENVEESDMESERNPSATSVQPFNEDEVEHLTDAEKPPVKKIVRVRKPENSESQVHGQRRRVVVSRRPQDADVIASNTIQARGPVTISHDDEHSRRNNFVTDNRGDNDLDNFNKIAALPSRMNDQKTLPTKMFPITYYTILTYLTTFLHGPQTNYASREATFSNVLDQTLNPSLVKVIKSSSGRIVPTSIDNIVQLAARTLEDTTTIVNLATQQNVYNSELFKILKDDTRVTVTNQLVPSPTHSINVKAYSTANINAIAQLPKTYLTMFTYSYTFYDGVNTRESTRAETKTKIAADPSQFLTEDIGTFINEEGLLKVGPETSTAHLGSRELEGTTTEVNLGLKTFIKVDNVRNVIIEKTPVFHYQTPQRVTPQLASNTQILQGSSLPILESSFSSANELFGASRNQNTATEMLPVVSSVPGVVEERKPVVKVTSVIHKPSGQLRSGEFAPRPGVRVRVRPVVSRRLVPSDLLSSFDLSFDINDIATDSILPSYTPPNMGDAVPTPVLEAPYLTDLLVSSPGFENEIASEEMHDGLSTDAMPQRKKLKVTVRRPQSESISRTHTRFVLPSRFEITSRPRFYVVTRTGALGVVSNTQKPFTVKVSRKLKPTADFAEDLPSTTVIYDTYTTLTSVPVIFGLETSYRNVLLTTSSPITVSFVPTTPMFADIMPSTVVLTYFTTTTFTIPYLVGEETSFTTLEETNSRVVTQTLDEKDLLSYQPISTSFPIENIPLTTVAFGPKDNNLASVPILFDEQPITSAVIATETQAPAYETKTFFTTYTFFTTFFAGTEPVISSSEQVVTNVVTVPLSTTDTPQLASIAGPVTIFDTTESVIIKTDYSTVTFYATLFSDTSSFVTPIEEVETQIKTITETFTIPRVISPTSPAAIEPTASPKLIEDKETSVTVIQTLYTTFTNFVTLFQGTDTVVTNLEEIVSNVVTLTVPADAASSFITETPLLTKERAPIQSTPVYTTREVLKTHTHYLTLFSNDQSILSSIKEVVTSYVTELATPTTPTYPPENVLSPSSEIVFLESEGVVSSPQLPFSRTSEIVIQPSVTEEDKSEIQTYHPELVPSIKTIFSTLTFYTTYYRDTSSIVASQEEILTSFVTLFVPPSRITTSKEEPTEVKPEPTKTVNPSLFVFTTTDYSTLTLYTTLFSGDEIVVISSEHVIPEVITATITPAVSPTQPVIKDESVLTFLTTFTYYTTYFSGKDPVIASSESVVTQFVTIEAPPSSSPALEVSIQATPVEEVILGVSTVTAADIMSSFNEDNKDIKIIGVSSAVDTNADKEHQMDSKVQIESTINSVVNIEEEKSNQMLLSPILLHTSSMPFEDKDKDDMKSIPELKIEKELTNDETHESSSDIFIMPTPEITYQDSAFPITSTSLVTQPTEIVGSDGLITKLAANDKLMIITGTDGFVTKTAETEIVHLSPVFVPSKQLTTSVVSEIKPATVIELSDLLGGNTALGGDIGLAIQDIVSRITGKKNKTETDNFTTEISTTEESKDATQPETTTEDSRTTEHMDARSGSHSTNADVKENDRVITPEEVDYPVFVLRGETASSEGPLENLTPVYVPPKTIDSLPSQILTVVPEKSVNEIKSTTVTKSISTSVITGARTIFIVPTKLNSESNNEKESYSILPDVHTNRRIPKLETETEISLESSKPVLIENDDKAVTPILSLNIKTSVISGIKTVFFDSVPKSTSTVIQPSSTTDFVLGKANVSEMKKAFTTITRNGTTVISRTTTGATTIFFPGQEPKHTVPIFSTRFITSVESITRTLALTTTRTYYTRDSTLTVPSVYTTTIPPRTFVSTIIGTRTILGILPEPSETVHIHKATRPLEHTTTVTTTTLIFNSIPSTVVRTLVLPNMPTKTVAPGAASTQLPSVPEKILTPSSYLEPNIVSAGTERPARPPEVGDSTSIVISDPTREEDLSTPKVRDETYLRAAGPRLHDFRPDSKQDVHFLRPPIVIAESTTQKLKPEDDPFLNGRNGICDPKCQPYKKEICKESNGLWTCQCRPGHARRDEHEICKEIQTFVVLLNVVKMGNDTVQYNGALEDNRSPEFQEFAKNAAEGISEAYSITNVKDHIWEARLNNVVPPNMASTASSGNSIDQQSGVVANLTLHVSKSVSSNLLEQELSRSLQLTDMRIGDSLLLATPFFQTIRDFDECEAAGENDCSPRATCVNLVGTFTCQCQEGYEEADDSQLPGRSCYAKTESCNYCHGRGDCLRGEDDKTFCRCQSMFVGRRCEINGLVLAVALPTAVALVVFLLCVVLCCCKKCGKKKNRPPQGPPASADSVFRGIALKGPIGGTLDRKAMIDSSSESSGEHHSHRKGLPHFEGYQESGDVTPRKSSKRSDLSLNRSLSTGYTTAPVMIPRARQPPAGKPMNYTVYDGQVYVW